MYYAFRRHWVFLLLLLALTVTPAFAQRLDGGLTGTVTDPSSAAVAGAQVTATNEATGVALQTVTTSAGVYTFPNLLVGSYTVKIEAKGFAPYVRKGITVSSNQVAEASPKLTVGTDVTTVEVVAGADVVDTTTSQISNSFGVNQVINLPTATASPLNLAILAPGTTTQGGGVLGAGGSVGGTRPRMNNFAIDGVDDNDQSVTGPVSSVITDAVQEFDLVTNQFSAEYGHSAGGQFNIISKSGTNNWHGDLFWILQNKRLNALDNLQKDSYDPTVGKPRYDDNRFGATVGGPIIKNKLFIFGAFEHHKLVQAATGVAVQTPTAAGLATLNALAVNSAVKNILAQFPAAGSANAGTETVTNPANAEQTFDIPLGWLNFIAPNYIEDYNWQTNGDLNLNKHQLHVRFLYNRQRAPNLPAPALPQFSGAYGYDVRKTMINEVWTLNDHLINDFRLGFTHSFGMWGVPSEFSNFPNVTMDSLANFVIGPESNSPQYGGQNVYQFVDQMTWSHGKHTFKFGGEYRRYISPSNFLPRARGDWYYSSLDNLLTDTVPVDFAKRGAGNGSFPGNSTAFYWFVQDDVKLTNRLTLNLGMRYEWNGIPFGDTYQPLNAISTLPGIFDFRVPRSDKNNFAPRLGFAWDPTGTGKWSVRGGFGMAYDVNFTNLSLLQLPPQLQSEQDPDITCALPNKPSWCSGYDSTTYAGGGMTGAGFLQNGGLLQVNVPPTTQADARASTGGIIVDQVAPVVYTWSVGVQRAIMNKSSIEVRYLGTISQNLPVQVQVNAQSPFDTGTAKPLQTWFSQSSVPGTLPLTSPTLAQFSAAAAVRPYASAGFMGAVTAFPTIGKSEYHSGSVDFIHRFQRGLYMRANYTFAKGWDNSTNELYSSLVNPRRPEDFSNLNNEWSRSTLDIRHKFALSWTYEVPKFKTDNAFVKGAMHGWSINGSYVAQSGQPITALSNADANGNLDSAGDRAILNPNGTGLTGTDVGTVYMNPATGVTCITGCDSTYSAVVGYYALNPNARFVRALAGAKTNIGRNTLTSPGLNNWNLAMFKNTYITEQRYIQFRLEMFNAFNHRQFSFANAGVFGNSSAATDNASYARVYTAGFMNPKLLNGGARGIQLSLRFFF